MKKYLLVVFGDFKNEKVINGLAQGMSTIVDSDFLKFQSTPGALVFHFASEVIEEDLYDFIVGLFYGVSENFILTEMTDKVTVHMEDRVKAHLLDLDKETESVDMTIDFTKLFKDDIEELSNDFVEFILDEFKQEVKTPSLNEILDKINEKGIKSLTQLEKEILDNYSKK
jgi:hypothetical protein